MAFIPTTVNGSAASDSSTPATVPARSIVGTSQTNPAVNYEFLTNSSSGWFDALGYTWMSITFIPTSASAGNIIFYGTNDTTTAPSGKAEPVMDAAALSGGPVTLYGPVGNTLRQFVMPITTRYIRVMVSAVVTGIVQMTATLQQTAPPLDRPTLSYGGALGASTGSLGTLTPIASTNFLGYVGYNNDWTTDVASTSIGYSGTSTVYTSSFTVTGNYSGAMAFLVNVASITSTPNVYISVMESQDNVNFSPIYDFELISAAGYYTSPTIRVNAPYYRYRYYYTTIQGTLQVTISHTYKSGVPGLNYRNYFDHSLVGGTTQVSGNVTPAYYVAGTEQVQLAVGNYVTGTSSCQYQLQGSQDGLNWYSLGSVYTVPFSGVGIAPIVNHAAKWVRVLVVANGTQQVSYINFTAIGP